MADDQISVELVAKVDGLVSGLSQATAAMQQAAGAMAGAFKSSGDAAKEHEGLLKSVLSGALFLEFKEIATEALHAVEEAFEATVEGPDRVVVAAVRRVQKSTNEAINLGVRQHRITVGATYRTAVPGPRPPGPGGIG